MIRRMSYHLLNLLIFCLLETSLEQNLLGTHFYVNQDNVLIDNTLKTVATLARPYDLVAFIRQSERLARVDHLQTYIDAVDDTTEPFSSTLEHGDQHDNEDNFDKCDEFTRDGESLVFQILQTNLYDTLHIPFELKNLSNEPTFNGKKQAKIQTCNQFCQVKTTLLTFDHLPSISTRYDEQEAIRIDDGELPVSIDYDQQARWATEELSRNRTSWLAYVYLSRYFHSNSSYNHAIDCLRCALLHPSNYEDLILVELANIVFRYGYIRDAIVFIEKAFDSHLRSKSTQIHSLFIRAILHFYLGNLCTIDSRFLLAIQFYNRTKILLERIRKVQDEQQLYNLSSSSLGVLSILSLSSISEKKIDALHCHLTLELSLQRKHHILQTKLAQLNQLRSITDELIHLNTLIKRDMSIGQSYLNYFRQLKDEQKQIICDWKSTTKEQFLTNHLSSNSFSTPRKYSIMMKHEECCSIDENHFSSSEILHNSTEDVYECRPRDQLLPIDKDTNILDKQFSHQKLNLISLRLAAIERTQSSYFLDDDYNQVNSNGATSQITLTSSTTWPTLTSRLPTDVIIQPIKEFILKQSNERYPPLKQNTILKLNEQQQLPTYTDCQIHYYGLPSIGDYPTVWLPLENKGLLNIKQAFYQGLGYQNKRYPLPWSPPLCTLSNSINERSAIIENHPIFSQRSRSKAPINRYDTHMLLNLYIYINSLIDEFLPIEEFGQRLRSVGEKHEHLLPEWIVHLLSSLYWRINGHLPHAIECGLKAHETITRNKTYKQWSDLTLVNLANILYLWGKYEDALGLTQQAYAINSHEPITNYFLGNLLALTKNNHTAAQEYYRRTLTIDPTNIYARRQLRLSYCYTMHATWELAECSEKKSNCAEKSLQTESMKFQPSILDNCSSIDRWLNRSCSISSTKREELLVDALRAYRHHGLCSSSSTTDECSQGFAATNQGRDIGHIQMIYDPWKQTFDYAFLFTNDYEQIFSKESKLKCIIYGTGRKSPKCRDLLLIDPNEVNPKHNMTWWRDPSTLYEHLQELIEMMTYEQRLNNQSEGNIYDRYLSDEYILSKEVQEKYLLNYPVHFNKNDCRNQSIVTYTPYLSTWISPQTKNIYLNQTFFQQIKKENSQLHQPICAYPKLELGNVTDDIQLMDYVMKKVKENLSLYKPETILRPILYNLLFGKNPTIVSREGDEKTFLGSFLASGLHSPVYNNSWLFFHTISLYWRLMGNASEALNCLFQSHLLSPSNVHDFNYLSMALIIYNSQRNINEAIYLLYHSLSIDPTALLLTHFTLGNAMARKSRLDLAERWYQSTLKLKSDFEPAKQRLRAIRC